MKSPISISESEWQVMRIAWEQAPVTTIQIVKQLSEKKRWKVRTIRTLIDRLVAKGALTYEVEGKRYLYRPSVSQKECIQRESRSFVERVFGGEPDAMLIHLVENTKLTPSQIKHLKRILTQKEK